MSELSPIIGLPPRAIVKLLESNVLATSKNRIMSPLAGDPGRVTVNPPPVVLHQHVWNEPALYVVVTSTF